MDNQFQRPQGVSNQPQNMPDKGTRTGVTDTYGADISGSATNTISGGGSGNFVIPSYPGGGCNDGGKRC
jgi:hypothetical protein